MKKRQVIQCICDFCGKKMYSIAWMAKHEVRCTKNPNRICGVCKMMEQDQPPIEPLLAILPDPKEFVRPICGDDFGDYPTFVNYTELANATELQLPALREAAKGCPACMMAALRQRGIPIPSLKGFNFTKMMQGIWTEINELRNENCCY
jgi:hypothetical protein